MLKNKRILIFGGDEFLLDEMLPVFKDNGAEITWINSSDIIDNSNNNQDALEFESIKTISTYEKELSNLIEPLESFDGVVFALSSGSLRPLSMTKPAITSNLFEVNCASFIELIRILQKKRKLNKGSSVLAYSSISSLLGLKTKLAYAISKAALNAAIINLAVELAPKKIRVNGILKGAVTTDMNHEHVKNMFSVGNDESGNSELGMSTPEELANLSIFLLSDSVKTMTGSLVKLDGGYSLN
jgi:NAD(P)-dependent dehydrogenase (short-subunit alcohol dehydrogenase family)